MPPYNMYRDNLPGERFSAHRIFVNELEAMPEVLGKAKATAENLGTLNRKGIEEEVGKVAKKSIAADLRRKRLRIDAVKKKNDDKRHALTAPAIDKTDVVAALMHHEILRKFNSLDPARQVVELTINPDPTVIAAVLSAPKFLTGLSDELRAQAEGAYVESNFPNQSAALQEDADAINILEMAFEATVKEVRTALGLVPHEFEKWLRDASPEIDREMSKSSGREIPSDIAV